MITSIGIDVGTVPQEDSNNYIVPSERRCLQRTAMLPSLTTDIGSFFQK
jgi:hypothetical protein